METSPRLIAILSVIAFSCVSCADENVPDRYLRTGDGIERKILGVWQLNRDETQVKCITDKKIHNFDSEREVRLNAYEYEILDGLPEDYIYQEEATPGKLAIKTEWDGIYILEYELSESDDYSVEYLTTKYSPFGLPMEHYRWIGYCSENRAWLENGDGFTWELDG